MKVENNQRALRGKSPLLEPHFGYFPARSAAFNLGVSQKRLPFADYLLHMKPSFDMMEILSQIGQKKKDWITVMHSML